LGEGGAEESVVGLRRHARLSAAERQSCVESWGRRWRWQCPPIARPANHAGARVDRPSASALRMISPSHIPLQRLALAARVTLAACSGHDDDAAGSSAGGARATRPCSKRVMSAGSLTTSTTRSRPPHRGHSMMSTPNTQLSSHPRVAPRSLPLGGPPCSSSSKASCSPVSGAGPGTISARHLALLWPCF